MKDQGKQQSEKKPVDVFMEAVKERVLKSIESRRDSDIQKKCTFSKSYLAGLRNPENSFNPKLRNLAEISNAVGVPLKEMLFGERNTDEYERCKKENEVLRRDLFQLKQHLADERQKRVDLVEGFKKAKEKAERVEKARQRMQDALEAYEAWEEKKVEKQNFWETSSGFIIAVSVGACALAATILSLI